MRRRRPIVEEKCSTNLLRSEKVLSVFVAVPVSTEEAEVEEEVELRCSTDTLLWAW